MYFYYSLWGALAVLSGVYILCGQGGYGMRWRILTEVNEDVLDK